MWGRKAAEIADLKRLVRVRTAERDEARGDHKAAHADIRYLAAELAKSERARTNLRALLWQTRNEGLAARRLGRALRACARYRADEAKTVALLVQLQQRYDHATGLDHPDIDAGAHWQERRTDKALRSER